MTNDPLLREGLQLRNHRTDSTRVDETARALPPGSRPTAPPPGPLLPRSPPPTRCRACRRTARQRSGTAGRLPDASGFRGTSGMAACHTWLGAVSPSSASACRKRRPSTTAQGFRPWRVSGNRPGNTLAASSWSPVDERRLGEFPPPACRARGEPQKADPGRLLTSPGKPGRPTRARPPRRCPPPSQRRTVSGRAHPQGGGRYPGTPRLGRQVPKDVWERPLAGLSEHQTLCRFTPRASTARSSPSAAWRGS